MTASWTIRPTTYRGQDGFVVGGRGEGQVWPTSIFAETRTAAELIRDALVARRDGHITHEECDALELIAFRLERYI